MRAGQAKLLRSFNHAPARVRLSGDQVAPIYQPGFNHAPARGATQCFFCQSITLHSFNPRTRTGCDCRVFKPALGADQKRSLREPHFLGRFFCYVFVKNRRIRLLEPGANLPGISCSLGVRAKIYIVNIPSGSYVSLAPTCSTLRFQLLPKK